MIDNHKRWKALCQMIKDCHFAGIYLNMNDVFGQATADVGEIDSPEELIQAVDIYIEDGWVGVIEWEKKRRGITE